jgi:murein DD-endopeptidase MepM/ murein hydrolase activator NlpD
MASIYESPDQQVQLTGSQTGVSFQPGTAFDPSRQMLQQSERDLGAFAQFSDTLTKFITDKAKEKNEQELQLGIADIVNGDMTPSADAYAKYQQDVAVLKTGAEEDAKVGNELGVTDPAVGEQFKANSKAVSGWRAYGRAVGTAQQAAGSALGFMTQWQSSTDKVLRTRDGRLISPSEAQEPDDIQAMLAMGQQEFIRTQQLAGINPMIIAEHLSPTMKNVKSQLFNNMLTKAIADKRETALIEERGVLRTTSVDTTATTESFAAQLETSTTNLVTKAGLSRGKAKDQVVTMQLEAIDNLPEDEALTQLAKLEQVRIEGGPNNTLGNLYAEEFKAARERIAKDTDALEARALKESGKEANLAYQNYEAAKLTSSNEDLKIIRENTIAALKAASDAGDETASQRLTAILTEPPNLDNQLYRNFIGIVNGGGAIAQDDVDKAFQERKITKEQKSTLDAYAQENGKTGVINQFKESFKDQTNSYLRERFESLSLTPDGNPALLGAEAMLIQAGLAQKTWDWKKGFKAQNGRDPNFQETINFIKGEVPKFVWQYLKFDEQKGWTPANPTASDPKWQSFAAAGRSIPDVVRLDPTVIRLGNLTSGQSRQITEEETQKGLDDVAAGRPPSARIQELSRLTPGGTVNFLRQQAGHNGIDVSKFNSSPTVQTIEQNFRTSPWATSRLTNSNNPYLQRSFQILQQQQARMRREEAGRVRATPSGGGSFEKPSSVVYENRKGQPGVDLFFESKRFPAVLGGVVKDVSQEPGYGNYVVVESVDPLTGQKVDVLYGHLADGVSLRPGQRINAGQVIGTQGGTGNVRSADGTIASIDFFAPRPSGSRDMTPYSGFDRLRRHVVNQLQNPRSQTTSSGGGTPPEAQGYMKRLAYLETRIRDIPNSQGSEGRGYFQAFNAFDQEATAAAGGISPRDSNYDNAAFASWKWIEKFNKPAAKAILAGRYDEADRLLRNTWPSLPSGSQQQASSAYREANRYLN